MNNDHLFSGNGFPARIANLADLEIDTIGGRLTDIYGQLERTHLANGLRVWCLPRPNSGTVALLAHFPIGARTENKINSGISHFLEHMVFTGTERWDETDIANEVRQRGGQYNAHTSREETTFYMHIDAADAEFGMEWLQQILFKPSLRPEKFEKERQVILNEKGGEYDRLQSAWEWFEDRNLGWSVTRAMRRRIYPKSTMLMPIIGRDKSLKNLTHQQLVDYYRTYYVPANMTLIVVGDIEPAEAFKLAEAQFGDIPTRTSPQTLPPVKTVSKPFNVRLQGPMPNDQGQYLVGYMLERGSHSDRFGWWVIEEILDNAFMRDIRYKLGLTYSINVFSSLYSDTGYGGVYARAKIQDLPVIKRTIEEHLDRLVAGDVTESELAEAKNAIRGRTLLDLQDNLEMASWLGFDALHTHGTDAPVDDYFGEIGNVTLADITRIAQGYFTQAKRFRVEHIPAFTPKQIRPAAVSLLGAGTMLWSLQRRHKHKHRR